MAEPFVKFGPDEVEQAFKDLADEKIDNTQFLQTLVQSKLYTLMDRPPEGALGTEDAPARMLRLPDEQGGGGEMTALYTQAENAQNARVQAPDFEHLGRVDVVWAVLHSEPGLGLLINPGEPRTFRIAPEGVGRLRQSVQTAINQ